MSVPSDDQPDPNSSDPSNIFNLEVLRRRMANLGKAGANGDEKNITELTQLYKDLNDDDDDDDEDGIISHPSEEEMDALRSLLEKLPSLWVIVFSSATDDSEGVYSLSLQGENIVLAFQDKMEAQRYSLSLQAQMFPEPQLAQLPTDDLQEFCSDSGFRLGFIPAGTVLTPPEESAVEDLEKWKGKEKKGKGGMTDDDLDVMRKRFDVLFGE